jgi:hypothetical protein
LQFQQKSDQGDFFVGSCLGHQHHADDAVVRLFLFCMLCSHPEQSYSLEGNQISDISPLTAVLATNTTLSTLE